VSDAPYREPLAREPDPYADAWAKMRRRRPWLWIGMPILLIGLGLVMVARFPLGVLLFVVSFAPLAYASPGKCPRCGKTFDRKGAYHNQFTTRCLNCGIRVGEPKGAA
jgi:hypothetical protein